MTLPTGVRAWLVGGGIVLALIVAVAAVLNHQHAQLAETQRLLEAEQLARHDEIVAHQETKAELNKVAAQKMAADKDLAVAAAKLKLLQPDAQVVSAATLSTGAVVVDAEPEEESPCEPTECGASRDGGVPVAIATASEGTVPTKSAPDKMDAAQPPKSEPSTQPCVLRNGDPASITVNELTFKTSAGNYIPVGTATAWREGPGPRVKLFSHAFEAALSDASGLAAPQLPRWGFGGQGVCFGSGCAAGPGVAFPPLRFTLFGHAIELDGNANVLVGSLGAGLGAGGYARF